METGLGSGFCEDISARVNQIHNSEYLSQMYPLLLVRIILEKRNNSERVHKDSSSSTRTTLKIQQIIFINGDVKPDV